MALRLSPPRTTSVDMRPNVLEAGPVLVECCEQATPCRLQLVHSGHSAKATLRTVSANGVVLRIAPGDHPSDLRPRALCCVAFPHRASFCAFLGCLAEVRDLEAGEREVLIATPQQLTVTNLRQSFRVPVIQQSGLTVVLRPGNQPSLTGEALNIAETGIEVDIASPEAASLSVGAVVQVEIRFRDECVQLLGEVRRLQGSHCALMFLTSAGDEVHRQSAQMHGLVLSLQQLWLKNRLC